MALFVSHISCDDCNTSWYQYCGICKQKAWQKKRVPKIKKKKSESLLESIIKQQSYHKKRNVNRENERLYWFNKHPKRVVVLILKGHDAACACCYTLEGLTFDHIIPLSKGGADCNSNGQILCYECNQLKGDKVISIKGLKMYLEIQKIDKHL